MDIVGVGLRGPSSEAQDLKKGSVDRVLLTGFQSAVLEALTACWAVFRQYLRRAAIFLYQVYGFEGLC